MIGAYRKGCMGTVIFEAKFVGMRKPQEFVVYPIGSDDEANPRIKIQSDTRIGFIDRNSGAVWLCAPQSNGAYNHHLALARQVDVLDAESLTLLKSQVMSTASPKAGKAENGIIMCDNSGALGVFA